MRKLAYTAFVAFWSSVSTMLALHVLAAEREGGNQAEYGSYTLEDVAAHNSRNDCWMVIEGKVYDITAYVDQHPAPPAVLLPWCGQEATEGMRTKGYGRDHSPGAWSMLGQYEVGTLKQ